MNARTTRALVTGGSGIIGGALCRHLAGLGHHVFVHANANEGRAEAVAEDIRVRGGSAEVILFDVADEHGAAEALAAAQAAGPIQVLVSNAGIHDDAPMAGMSGDQWRRVIDVSLNGFFNVARPILLPMMRTRWGRIVAVSSVAGVMGNRGQANYAAAKSGLHGAVKSLALECATRGVTVNAVAPGVIKGPDTDRIFPPDRLKAMVPMQRAGTAEEVAETVGFLCGRGASYVSGQIISVNGAMT